ncbi:alpha/beta hydrolase [Siphonobacter sp. SORGH_AS_1065]|uniref:alpha/beta hydrolase n=1 Tax=Siphonobacter sp. SORGH_AS_1065 TaxID=3041795 RepID=UPI00278262D0|nr:alpha/beta hydrolase [Siphonobacter sp. SORGH_AS_1065]MDQ1090569.1 acetyl esterase/lipase [Siphonobacter sp. SORGH_AS_1065]
MIQPFIGVPVFLVLLLSLGCTSPTSVGPTSSIIPLWPAGRMPDSTGVHGPLMTSSTGNITNVAVPYLIIHKPTQSNGRAILVISGGGYKHIESGNESGAAANWLSGQGFTAFELIYRLPAENWQTKFVAFEDGQRALRLIKSLAPQYHYEATKVGVMGFSAGGHLAGMLATVPQRRFYQPIDELDSLRADVQFAALLYPVVTMLPPYNSTVSKKVLFGNGDDLPAERQYSVEQLVSAQTPPMFLAQAKDDSTASVQNSELLYQALSSHGIGASQLQLFESGGHGWGLGKAGTPETVWPSLFQAWAVKNGFW